MKDYFDDIERREKLLAILESWLGTPFRHHSGVKGLGTDCIHFVGRVFEEMGLVRWKKDIIPDYPRDWHLHSTREMLKERVLKELKVVQVSLGDELKDGDILLFHLGKAASHAGIYYKEYVYQAVERMGVCKVSIVDKVAKRQLKFILRVIE
jgi:cell wall-associated NlpC family hydrolase